MKAVTAFSNDSAAALKAFNSGVIVPLLFFIRASHRSKAKETVFEAWDSNFDDITAATFFMATPMGSSSRGWHIRQKQRPPYERWSVKRRKGEKAYPFLQQAAHKGIMNMHHAAC